MSALSNKAARFLGKVAQARGFAAKFGITIPGVKVNPENLDIIYVSTYTEAYIKDLCLIAEQVKVLWLDSVEGKNSLDTRELAKLNKVIKDALHHAGVLLKSL